MLEIRVDNIISYVSVKIHLNPLYLNTTLGAFIGAKASRTVYMHQGCVYKSHSFNRILTGMIIGGGISAIDTIVLKEEGIYLTPILCIIAIFI